MSEIPVVYGIFFFAPAEFIVNRRWSKPVESRVGQRVRVDRAAGTLRRAAVRIWRSLSTCRSQHTIIRHRCDLLPCESGQLLWSHLQGNQR